LRNTFFIPLAAAAVLLIRAQTQDPAAPQIAIQQRGDRWDIRLENNRIRVEYGRTDFGDIVEDQIVHLVLKKINQDQAGKQFDEMGFGAHEGRGLITQAKVITDTPAQKTVRIEWDKGKAIQDVTIYRDSQILKMDYLKYGVNLVDLASPGGGTGTYVAYGSDRWKRPFVTYPKIYFDRHPKDVGYENIAEVDESGPLDYHGWFIMGVYNPANGRGFGRVMPSEQIDIVKLLHNRGFEWFTCYGRERQPFTGYVFLVTGGAREIEETGKQLADGELPAGELADAPLAKPAPPAKVGPGFRRVVVDGRSGAWYQDVKITGDFNGDGFIDLVAGRYPLDFKDPAPLTYYQYPEWDRKIISMGYFTTDGQSFDIDKDGDVDVVTADEMAKSLYWYENPRPRGDPLKSEWKRHLIGIQEGGHFAHDIEIGDLNGDGKPDVLTRARRAGTSLWLQRSADHWQAVKLASAMDGQGSTLTDIDRDGALDIVGEGYWLENPAPKGDPERDGWPIHWFAKGWPDDVAVTAADLNGDGRTDVILAPAESTGRMVWFEAPAEPKNGTWAEHTIVPVSYVHTFKVADVDLDGALDIVFGEMHQSATKRIGYLLNRNNGRNWHPVVISHNGVHNIRAADIGNDGDIDIVTANWAGENPLEIWENQLRSKTNLARTLPLNRWTYIQVDDARGKWGDLDEPKWLKYFGLNAGDFNRDNLRDIVAGRYVYLNPGGGMMKQWKRIDFPINVDGLVPVHAEKDGQLDVIAAALPDVYWMRPDNPQATTWTPIKVATLPRTEHRNGQGYATAQLEPGGASEVVLSTGEGLYYLRIPKKPREVTWPQVRITSDAAEEGFGVADINGDGLLDVAASSRDGKTIYWFANPDRGKPDWKQHVIGRTSGEWPDRFAMADLNGDGRMDLVVTEETKLSGAALFWFEQPADPTHEWSRRRITTGYTMNSMDVADMNNDGLPDIIVSEHRGLKRLVIWENVEHGARFVPRLIGSGREGHLGARVFDLDGDSDLDIVSTGWDSYRYLHVWRNDAITSTPAESRLR
jgi:hypothetical protein